MCPDNKPVDVFFGPNPAWNIVEAAVREGLVPEYQPGSKAETEISLRKRDGSISEEQRIRALQMFVFANSAVLPGQVLAANFRVTNRALSAWCWAAP